MVKPAYVLLPVLLLILAAGAFQARAGSVQIPAPGEPPIYPSLPVLPGVSSHQGSPGSVTGRIAGAADFSNPVVTHFVQTHTRVTPGMNTIAQVCDLWEEITNQWNYMPDSPEGNKYQPASISISTGLNGNCLDYAILNAAAITSLGGESRVVIAYDSAGNGHAYPEVYLGDYAGDIQTTGAYLAARYNTTAIFWHTEIGPEGRTGYWLNLDWQARYPGGPRFVDNGTYYASSISGTGAWYTDNGYPVRDPAVMLYQPGQESSAG